MVALLPSTSWATVFTLLTMEHPVRPTAPTTNAAVAVARVGRRRRDGRTPGPASTARRVGAGTGESVSRRPAQFVDGVGAVDGVGGGTGAGVKWSESSLA